MKRDMDLIRELLLAIERSDDGSGASINVRVSGYSEAQVVDHLFQLHERGFIDGVDVSHMNGRAFLPIRVTSYGHDFLDSVRDPEIWRKTKDGAKAAGGFTVELLAELAKGFIKTQIKRQTGIEIQV
ncbi:MAG: DUF2513 domain-containing protein [Rhizobiaceae bacterium]|nr:DUF2513 domain-containing protein [Rhizobiaceae bacterium]